MLHCSVASSLWDIIFSLFGVLWVFPRTVKEACLSWRGFLRGKEKEKDFEVSPYLYFLDRLEGEKSHSF